MHRRLQFRLCDLLWATLVVALALGWWLDHQSWVEHDRHQHTKFRRVMLDVAGIVYVP